ncbi:D-alanyl-D-alanine carboxypeptidase PBP3 [Streptococcus ovuberis]|uniref:serine-type D-Ala-D-Ala carboxypeptidase n=1 Tax=Streptococcus ovuberis TaxID=1936207 RepID=A0A7X6S1N3_9STRE|nr:D-alanyl-D-alanine carboxypeptidase PBP3 [Streptococcus ovuberis]NKZ20987.1 D-alanyl-D-alanine carboxypeptidase [Streptococcus ovuberis]
MKFFNVKPKLFKHLLTVLMFCLIAQSQLIQAQEHEGFDVPANHVMAIEATTGKILYEKASETVTGTASTSKLLTAYMVYEAIDNGKITLSDAVSVSNYAYELSLNTEIANIPLDARLYTVKELLDAVLIHSANGASVALAEHISGTEARFVDAMSAKLKEWEIDDAKLVNATGISNRYLGNHRYPDSKEDAENMMSARSLAIIARKLLQDYPQVTETTSLLSANWSYTTIFTWNLLLKGAMYSRPSVDGLMTGTSEKSGSSLVASSTENGMRVITVLLGAHGGEEDPDARFVATNQLLNHIKDSYYFWTILPKGKAYEGSKSPVFNGNKSHATAVAKSDFNVVQKMGEPNLNLTFKAIKKTPEAPIKQGQTIGQITFEDDGYLGTPPTMTMVAKEDVKRAIFFKVWWNNFVRWVNEDL